MNILSPFDNFQSEAKKIQSGIDWDSKQQFKEDLILKGLPSRKEESWRNTSLKFLNDLNFIPATSVPSTLPPSILKLVKEKRILDSDILVLANGFEVPSISEFDSAAITIESLSSLQNSFHGDPDSEAIHSLNQIYNLNAIEIKISKDLSRPLQILNVTYLPFGTAVVSSPQVHLILKTNVEAKVVLSNVGEKDSTYFSNGRFTFSVEKDARLEVINHVDQSERAYHFDFVGINAQRASNVRYFELNLNGQLTRHELVLELNGENVQSEVLGASFLREKQHCDSQTFINHHKGNCRSDQVYKAVLDNEARSVFSGTVFIADGIAKADSSQLNQNLLLSDQAEVNSKPILRIYSDDVKASHGSTIGQVSDEEVFYLQSRCISRTKAIALLSQGFLNEIIFRIGSESLRTYFGSEVLQKMQLMDVN